MLNAENRGIRCAGMITRTNIASWRGNRWAIFVLCVMAMLCYTSMNVLKECMQSYQWTVSIAETYLYVLTQQMLLIGTLFLLMMSEVPKNSAFQNFQLIRSSRYSWLTGQLMYCASLVCVFFIITFLLSILFSISFSSVSLTWSDAERVASGVPESMSVFPVDIRTHWSLLGAVIGTFFLTGSYWMVLANLVLAGGIFGKNQIGLLFAMMLQLLPWVINTFSSYVAPKWFPVNYANLMFLSYDNGLLPYWTALGCFIAANLLLVAAMYIRVKHIPLLFGSMRDWRC